jgi:hypothetical protein
MSRKFVLVSPFLGGVLLKVVKCHQSGSLGEDPI